MTYEHNWGFNRKIIELQKIYRQEDVEFKDILNSIRDWSITKDIMDRLNSRVWVDLWEWWIYLTTLNRMAEQINQKNYER